MNIASHNSLFTSMGRRWRYLVFFGIVLGIAGILSVSAPSKPVYASGSVGSGGGGTGSTGDGHYTEYGWGWVQYSINANGPSDNFRDGSTWSSVKETCTQDDNAQDVDVFIIYDSSNHAEGYNYTDEDGNGDGGAVFQGKFTVGQSIDGGGTVISSGFDSTTGKNTGQVVTDYNQVPAAERAPFTFATNNGDVAWFCSHFGGSIQQSDVDAHSTVSQTTIGTGQTTKFQHWTNNINPTAAYTTNYSYRVEGCFIKASVGTCNWSTTGCGNLTSNCPTLPNGSDNLSDNYDPNPPTNPPPLSDTRNAPVGGITYSFPSSLTYTDSGDQYCQRLEVNPGAKTIDDDMDSNNSSDGSWYTDHGSCVTYSQPKPPPPTLSFTENSSVTPAVVTTKQGNGGAKVSFSNSVTYQGNASSETYSWQLYGNYKSSASGSFNGASTTHFGGNASGDSNACSDPLQHNTESNEPPGTNIPEGIAGHQGYCTYEFPSNASAGAEFCLYVQVTDSNGKTWDDSGGRACVTYEPNGGGSPTYSPSCGGTTFTVPGASAQYPYGVQAFVGVSGTQSGIQVTDSVSGRQITYTSESETSQPPGQPGSPYTEIIRRNYTSPGAATATQQITVSYAAGSNITISILIREATDASATTFTNLSGYPQSTPVACDTAPTVSITANCSEIDYSFDDIDDSSAAVATITATTAQYSTPQTIGTETGGSSGSIDTPSRYIGFQPTTYTITVQDILINGARGTLAAATEPFTITCPPQPLPQPQPQPSTPQISCGGLGGVGSDEEAGTSFNLSFSVNYVLGQYGSPPQSPPAYMAVSSSPALPGGSNGDVALSNITNQSATASVTIGASADAGTYLITWVFNDGSQPLISCSASLTLYNYPYVNFFGGDVTAGGGFGTTSCADTSTGKIYGYLNSDSTTEGGSGNQFGVEALNVITGFGSDSLNGTGNYSDLSFANAGTAAPTGNAPTKQFGGYYGVSNNCVPDYYAAMPSGGNTVFNGSLASGTDVYNLTGNQTIGTLNVGNGVNAAIYVNGNVYIDGNIEYSGSGTGAGAWNISNIPSLYIVAKGNIYIAPGVTQLDGVYVAQPNGTADGVINTCANPSAGIQPSADANYYTECQNQLTVNGAFVAQNIFLDRSYSSLRYSQKDDNPYMSVHSCGSEGSSNDCAAEIFNFSPELYLSQPASTPTSGPASTKFDYITSLPPVL